jgi:DNA adenine methylase
MKKNNLTLLRYPGGKYYALSFLLPFCESIDHDEYREPFFGGGSVFWAKEKSKSNWINDLEPELINLLKCIQNEERRNQLIKLFDNENEATKEQYLLVKNLLPRNEIERAYKYFYLNRTSFSGKMKSPSWGYRPKRSVPPIRWKEKIVPAGIKLANVKITNLDFSKVINEPAKGNKVLIFLDPPYYNVKQENHYIMAFELKDHIRLANDLKQTKHKFFLTYDDCPEIRKLYSWAFIKELSFFYRLDNSQDNKRLRKMGNELIISNFEVKIAK